jgi:hypothetical protein
VFCLSRITYWHLGLRFDASLIPDNQAAQFIDLALLKHHLFQSLFYLHDFPPLFNLFLGLGIRLFPRQYVLFFNIVYLIIGIFLFFGLVNLMKRMRVRPFIGATLSIAFMVSPVVLKIENLFFYEYPAVTLMVWSAVYLHRFIQRRENKDGLIAFSLMAIVILMRGCFSLHWLILMVGVCLVMLRAHIKQVLLVVVLPVLLVFSFYLKNYVLFGGFSINEATVGQTVSASVFGFLPPTITQSLVDQKKIAGVYRIPLYCWDYTTFDAYHLIPRKTGIPILDERFRSNGSLNCHNLVFLRVGRAQLKEACYIIEHYPHLVLKGCWQRLATNYYEPIWMGYIQPPLKRVIRDINADLSGVFRWGLPLLMAWGVLFSVWVIKKGDKAAGVIFIYMTLSIFYVLFLCLFTFSDYSRYRFLVDPFFIVILGSLLTQIQRVVARKL